MTANSDTHLYTLRFSGSPDADFLADYCPTGTTLTVDGGTFTLSNLCADQCEVLGIIRRLHNLGCTLKSLATERNAHARQPNVPS